jgi:hypothetical protein
MTREVAARIPEIGIAGFSAEYVRFLKPGDKEYCVKDALSPVWVAGICVPLSTGR